MGEHLERASTGRARCKVCKEVIDKGALRMGTTGDSSRFDGTMTVWSHAICASMRSPVPFLRAIAAYEGKVDAAEKTQLEAIANTVRVRKLVQVVWRHATEPRCLLEFAQDYYVLFTKAKDAALVVRGTLDDAIASVPDEDLEAVVDTATASGKKLGRPEPKKTKAAPSTAKLRQRYEVKNGSTTYAYEYTLDEATLVVTYWMEAGPTGKKLSPYGKPTKKKLEDLDLARKYFRYLLSNHIEGATLVDGDPVTLDPDEDFKSVKDKSSAYRYLENATAKRFWDIDRDESVVTIWEGAIGTTGTKTVHEYDWDGEAKDEYKEMLAAKLADGYKEPPGLAGRRAAGKRG